jgi:hypothetical protein
MRDKKNYKIRGQWAKANLIEKLERNQGDKNGFQQINRSKEKHQGL